jgi:starvation-inducible DNA-binding protein
MDPLQAALRVTLANAFIMYFKSHSYHWNVEGSNFSQYHSFFGDLYEDVHGSIDDIAEHIRAIDGYAPFSLMDLYDSKTISEDSVRVSDTRQMFQNLLDVNTEVLNSLTKAFSYSQTMNNQGLCNYIADRLDVHAKWAWQIKSFIK